MKNRSDAGLSRPRIVLLDAMGVMYEAADDVAELLVPFIRSKGSAVDPAEIAERYREASLGNLTAAEFWRRMKVESALEDEYLAQHRLREGLLGFLASAREKGLAVSCLSNDLSEWSRKLRRRFALEDKVTNWLISGDLGFRKPDSRIYQAAIGVLGVAPQDVLLVDDRDANVEAARQAGLQAIRFGVATHGQSGVSTFEELTDHLFGIQAEA